MTKRRADFIAELSETISEIRPGHPVRVAIDGIDGAGKTTLADELVEPIRRLGREAIRASIDSFHNPREIRYRRGRWSPEGYFYDSFDCESVKAMILEPLGPSGNRRYRTAKFDHRTDLPIMSPLRHADQNAILLLDGIFLRRPELAAMWDLTIFLDVSFEEAEKRCRTRDESFVSSAESVDRYVGGQALYFRLCRPKESANIVVDYENLSSPRIIRAIQGSDREQRDCSG